MGAGPPAALHLLVRVEHPVDAVLRREVLALIRQVRHDLRSRQCGVVRLVADDQDPLPVLSARAVRHMPMSALAPADMIAIHNVPISARELASSALQRAQADPHVSGIPVAEAPAATAPSSIRIALCRCAAELMPPRPLPKGPASFL